MPYNQDLPGLTQVFGPNCSLTRPREIFPQPRRPTHSYKSRWDWKKFQANLIELFREFCSSTTVHGMQHIGSGKTLLGRLGWMVVIALSVFCCGMLIYKVYQKWDHNPVIVSFGDKPIPVWKIPYPAITICNENKIDADKMNFTNEFYAFYRNETLSEQRLDQLMAVLHVCDDYFYNNRHYKKPYLNKTIDVVALLDQVLVQMKPMAHVKSETEQEYFGKSLTEEGFCHTFNGVSAQDMFNDGVLHSEYEYLTGTNSATKWTMEKGYAPGTQFDTYPLRGTAFASKVLFYLETNNHHIESHCIKGQGFKVILHAPDEYPFPNAKFMLLPPDRIINMGIRPHILTTAEELANYSPTQRQCFFSYERRLKFFRVYNQNNCELECLTNYTLSECGCVKFSMPRSTGTRVCSTAEQKCIVDASYSMLTRLLQKSVGGNGLMSACNCMPACNSIEYLTEITYSAHDFFQTFELRLKLIHPNWSVKNKSASTISAFFMGNEFLTTRRGELFGVTDFIANCGGILGLCLGVSVVGLVELLYFCVARPLDLMRNSLGYNKNVIFVEGSSLKNDFAFNQRKNKLDC